MSLDTAIENDYNTPAQGEQAMDVDVRAIALGISGRFWADENPIQLPLDLTIQWTQSQSSLDLAIHAERRG